MIESFKNIFHFVKSTVFFKGRKLLKNAQLLTMVTKSVY